MGLIRGREYRHDRYGCPAGRDEGPLKAIRSGCFGDGFDYFRGWLLAQGHEVFKRALRDPESLADRISEMEEAECQDMNCVAAFIYKKLTSEYPKGPRIQLPALGEGWDFDDATQMRNRYPRLWAKLSES